MEFGNDLVRETYKGVFENPYWRTLLDSIRVLTGAYYVSFAFRSEGEPATAVRILHSSDEVPDRKPEELKPWQDEMRSALPYSQLEPGRVYTLDDFLDPANRLHERYRHYLASRSIEYNRVIRVAEPFGVDGWLGVSRKGEDFRPEAHALLESIAPHLGIAVRILAALERERARASILADAVRRLDFGWLTLDSERRVVEASPEVVRIFQDTAGLSPLRVGSVLHLPGKAEAVLKESIIDILALPAGRLRTIHVLDEPWLDIVLVRTDVMMITGGADPIATAYIHGSSLPSADRSDQLRNLFGLTNTEAQIALALSRGMTLSESASVMSITISTARYYSKRIYSKTGTRNQADLVRLILSGIIALT